MNDVIARRIHRTYTALFHRLSTIPVENGVGVTSTRTRILAPCILGHDSLVPSVVAQSGNETTATNSWKFSRIRPLQLRTFRCTMHYFSLLSLFEWRLEVFRPFVVVISPKFCGSLVHGLWLHALLTIILKYDRVSTKHAASYIPGFSKTARKVIQNLMTVQVYITDLILALQTINNIYYSYIAM